MKTELFLFIRPLLRLIVTAAQGFRRVFWFVTRAQTFGVDAIAVTPESKVILVRLTYAKGWHLPGGGRRKFEQPVEAILRELREEIGLRSHGKIETVGHFSHRKDFKSDSVTVFLVRDVKYEPRRSLEIDATAEFELTQIPMEATHARKWVEEAQAKRLL